MERRSIFPATLLKRLLQGLAGLALLITFGNCGDSNSESGDKVAFVATTNASCDAHALNPGGPNKFQNMVYVCPGHPIHLCWSALTRARAGKIEPDVGNVVFPYGTAMVQPTNTKEYRFSGTHNDPPAVQVTVVVNGLKIPLIARPCSAAGGAPAYCYDASNGSWDAGLHATSVVVDSDSVSCFASTQWTITHVGANGDTDSINAKTNAEVSIPASWAVDGSWKLVPSGACAEPPPLLHFRLTCVCKQ